MGHPACARVLGDQLGVGQAGEHGAGDADEERGPERATDLGGHQANEGVNARAEYIAEHIEAQQGRGSDGSAP